MKDVLKAIDDRMTQVDMSLPYAHESAREVLKSDRVFLSELKTLVERRASEFSENKSEKIPEPAHTGGCLSDWKCAMCGKANPAFTMACEHCNAYRFTDARPPASTPEPQKSEGAYVIPFDGKSLPPMYGWICPVCGRGNSPTSDRCGCKDEPTDSFYNPVTSPSADGIEPE